MSEQEKNDIKQAIEFTTGEEPAEKDPIMDIEPHIEMYVAAMDQGRALVSVDLALAGTAPVPRLHWLLGVQLELNDPDAEGMYTPEEEPRLMEVQARIIEVMHNEGHCRFVGTVTYAGMRMIYFYGRDENYLAPLVGKLAAEHDDYDFNFMSENDGVWAFYFNGLYPGDVDLAHIHNRQMVMNLRDAGVDLSATYPVYYYFYFQDGASRAQVASRLMMQGFEIVDDHIYVEDLEPMSLGLKMLAHHDLEYITLTEKTYDCYDLLDEFVGLFDGWEIAATELTERFI